MNTTALRLALALCVGVFAAPAAGTENAYIVREVWELRLDTPNVAKNTPQVVTHFKIDSDTFVITCLNFRDQPAHVPGGIQIQLWDQGAVVDTVDVTVDSLNTAGDVITWTQVYTISSGGNLEANLENVDSQTWGQIAVTEAVVRSPASVSTFNTYDPTTSVVEAHVNYGHNAVVWFGMTESTTWKDVSPSGKLWTDPQCPRTVYAR